MRRTARAATRALVIATLGAFMISGLCGCVIASGWCDDHYHGHHHHHHHRGACR